MKNETVLIFDNQTLSKAIIKGIVQGNYNTIEVSSLTMANNTFARSRTIIDFIIVSDSVEYEEFLKANEIASNNIPTIMVGNTFSTDEKKRANKLGVSDFFTRPLVKEDVLGRMEALKASSSSNDETLLAEIKKKIEATGDKVSNVLGSVFIDFNKGSMQNSSGALKDLIKKNPKSSYNELIYTISSMILSDKKDQFVDTFCFSNIKRNAESGTVLSLECLVRLEEENNYVTFSFVPSENQTAGTLTLFDKTHEYYIRKTANCLYENEYTLIAVMSRISHKTSVLLNNTNSLLSKDIKYYSDLETYIINSFCDEKNKNNINQLLEENHVIEKLNRQQEYEILSIVTKDKMIFYTISFRYLDEFKNNIIIYVNNTTRQKEIDFITEVFNYTGFLNQTFDIINKEEGEYYIVYCHLVNYKNVFEYINVSKMTDFIKDYVKKLENSFLKPVCTGRDIADSIYLLVEKDNLDFAKFKTLTNIEVVDSNNRYVFDVHFGIYKVDNNVTSTSELETFCERAKIAESSIKKEDMKNYSLFNESFKQEYIISSTIINGMLDAVANNEFQPFFQPIFDITGSKVVSAEALARWEHPQYGMIQPDMFIKLAESNGNISLIDKKVLENVDQFLNVLNEKGYHIPISVNLSRLDFFDEELVSTAKAISKAHRKKKSYINYEVTESYYIDLTNTVTEAIDELRTYGAKILLDDFGDGFSSFNALINSSFDIIKIYKGLIDKIEKSAISCEAINSIIYMSHQAGLKVIAEGVETPKQLAFLKKCKCDYIQGYIFSKPLTKQDFYKLITKKDMKD